MAYDKKKFLSGLAMGLCGKGDPIFKGSGKMLYNGKEFPDVYSVYTPELQKQYPFAILTTRYNDDDGSLNLANLRIYASNAYYTLTDSGNLWFGASPNSTSDEKVAACLFSFRDDSWVLTAASDDDSIRIYPPEGSTSRGVTTYTTWTNFDAEYGGILYRAASKPVLVEDAFSKGYHAGAALRRKRRIPVAYLYNDERLPKLPDLPYEYAVIEYADAKEAVSGGRLARLICSSEPIALKSGITMGYNLNGDVRYYGFANNDFLWGFSFSMNKPYPPTNVWAQIGEAHFDEITFVAEQVGGCDLIWANHDVINANYGYVSEPASAPVPVYE